MNRFTEFLQIRALWIALKIIGRKMIDKDVHVQAPNIDKYFRTSVVKSCSWNLEFLNNGK